MRSWRGLSVLLVAATVACIPPNIDLSGKQCDAQGLCASGYTCVEGLCVMPECTAGAVRSCGSSAACSGPTQTCGADLQWGACSAGGDGGAPLCPKQLGVCQGAVEACGSNGQWEACTDATYLANNASYSTTEVCDGLDNNCDGEVDEDPTPQLCALQLGVCAGSTAACGGDAGWLPCTAASYGPNYSPSETCDGLDNDCNGQVDDGLNAPLCALNQGVCARSRESCGGDAGWLPCTAANYGPNYSATELCDGLDNNCNGQVDEDLPSHQCALQDGVCAGSTATCGGDAGWLPCTTATYTAYSSSYDVTEKCDGLDNDCNGRVDDDLVPIPCADQLGVCLGSTATCGGDAGWLACTAANYTANNPAYSAAPVCSDLDVMCSGTIDATFTCVKDANDGGACMNTCGSTGTATCESTCGQYICVPTSLTCNGCDVGGDGTIGGGLTQASAKQISNDAATSQSSGLAVGLDGGLAVYADNTTGKFQIHVQPVDASLAPVGAFTLASATSNDQMAPRIFSVAGGYVVTWLEANQVWAIHLAADGSSAGTPFALGGSSAQAVSYAAAVAARGSDATLYVVWEDTRTSPSQLYFEPIIGSAPGAVTEVSPSAGPLHNPALSESNDGGYLGLAYEDDSAGASAIALSTIVASTGALSGSALILSGTDIGFYPSIAPAGSGFAVAWQAVGSGGGGIAINVAGGATNAVAPIPDGGGSNTAAPYLAAGPNGFALTWQDDRASPGTPAIWMARLNEQGSVGTDTSDPALLHLPLTSGNAQFAPFVLYTGATYAVSWEVTSTNYDVFAQEICP